MRYLIMIVCLATLFSKKVHSQDSLVVLTELKASVSTDRVGVTFTLGKGSFCYGAQLQRTADTLNQDAFEQIGEIEGVCGDQNFEASYTLWDYKPNANQLVYYRVVTGFIPSKFLPVKVEDYLTNKHGLAPNPMRNSTIITFPSGEVRSAKIEIYGLHGNLINTFTGNASSNIQINRGNMASGTYVYRIYMDGLPYDTGKLLVY